MAMLAAGPMMVVFPFFQKYFAKGMTVGAMNWPVTPETLNCKYSGYWYESIIENNGENL